MSADNKSILEALRLIEQGDWQGSHDIVEKLNSREAAHVHAHLHRVEGDNWNANYWYRRAGEPEYKGTLDDELKDLIARYTL